MKPAVTKNSLARGAMVSLALAVLLLASPAWASPFKYPQLPGLSIAITGCFASTTYPANTPFSVYHGYAISQWPKAPPAVKEDLVNPGTTFTLYVDGVAQSSLLVYTYEHSYLGTTDVKLKWFVTDFPNGMTGTHTFLGVWNDASAAGLVGGNAECILAVAFN